MQSLLLSRLRLLSEQVTLAALLVTVAAGLFFSGWLWTWNQLIYDWHIRQWQRPAPDDIVIVAIDQSSLNELGQWPWPRRVHAELVDRLIDYQTKAIALDVIFSEANLEDPSGDAQLIDAVRRSGRVVLPVVFEQPNYHSGLGELQPFSGLDSAAARRGHVDMDIDRDGIARTMYLRAGIGEAYWPSLALALLEVSNDRLAGADGNLTQSNNELPGQRAPPAVSAPAPDSLQRDYKIWLPFAGPPGHYRSLSYVEVLRGTVPAEALRDKIALVGFTAVGLDNIPTPVSAWSRPMSGIEVHANLLDTLRSGLWLLPLSWPWALTLTLFCALLPLIFYARLSPRWALPVAILALLPPLVGSALLLRLGQLWFPPAAALLTVIIGYLVWSWRQLQSTLRYLSQELERLSDEPPALPRLDLPELGTAAQFLRHTLPLIGCSLYRADGGGMVQQWGDPPTPPKALFTLNRRGDPLKPNQEMPVGVWVNHESSTWIALNLADQRWYLGVNWESSNALNAAQQRLLDELISPHLLAQRRRPITPVEVLQIRIQEVQQATAQLRAMRMFITDSLAQMADGVVVADSFGRVLLANPRAAFYLTGSSRRELAAQQLTELLAALDFQGQTHWQHSLATVLIDQQLVQLSAQSRYGHDLLVQMAPFTGERGTGSGLVLNFSDVSALRASERRRAEMLSFLSHDLRSPLASVIALTQLGKMRPEQLADGSITAQIEDRTHRVLQLVDSFLQLARAESDEDITETEVDLISIAEAAVEQVKPLAEAKSTQISTRFDDEQAWIVGNTALLLRVLVNLLSNAIKYSPDQSFVRLGVEQRDGELCCWVKDNGYGVAAKDIPNLFDRFRRIDRKEHRRETGTGLGLAFVKTVVERYRGRIDVDSTLDQGSCFYLYFPRPDAADGAAAASSQR